ncbi:unnamed protein product [Amoebophrya sp. A120]|nr:unnamed protein product [Amoebophrya sp. A120]|eukprot:GSA120T00000116001.1
MGNTLKHTLHKCRTGREALDRREELRNLPSVKVGRHYREDVANPDSEHAAGGLFVPHDGSFSSRKVDIFPSSAPLPSSTTEGCDAKNFDGPPRKNISGTTLTAQHTTSSSGTTSKMLEVDHIQSTTSQSQFFGSATSCWSSGTTSKGPGGAGAGPFFGSSSSRTTPEAGHKRRDSDLFSVVDLAAEEDRAAAENEEMIEHRGEQESNEFLQAAPRRSEDVATSPEDVDLLLDELSAERRQSKMCFDFDDASELRRANAATARSKLQQEQQASAEFDRILSGRGGAEKETARTVMQQGGAGPRKRSSVATSKSSSSSSSSTSSSSDSDTSSDEDSGDEGAGPAKRKSTRGTNVAQNNPGTSVVPPRPSTSGRMSKRISKHASGQLLSGGGSTTKGGTISTSAGSLNPGPTMNDSASSQKMKAGQLMHSGHRDAPTTTGGFGNQSSSSSTTSSYTTNHSLHPSPDQHLHNHSSGMKAKSGGASRKSKRVSRYQSPLSDGVVSTATKSTTCSTTTHSASSAMSKLSEHSPLTDITDEGPLCSPHPEDVDRVVRQTPTCGGTGQQRKQEQLQGEQGSSSSSSPPVQEEPHHQQVDYHLHTNNMRSLGPRTTNATTTVPQISQSSYLQQETETDVVARSRATQDDDADAHLVSSTTRSPPEAASSPPPPFLPLPVLDEREVLVMAASGDTSTRTSTFERSRTGQHLGVQQEGLRPSSTSSTSRTCSSDGALASGPATHAHSCVQGKESLALSQEREKYLPSADENFPFKGIFDDVAPRAMRAAILRYREGRKLWMQFPKSVNDVSPLTGNTLLMQSIVDNESEVAKYLIILSGGTTSTAAASTASCPGGSGGTSSWISVANSSLGGGGASTKENLFATSCFELIDHRAAKTGNTCLTLALELGHFDVAELILKHPQFTQVSGRTQFKRDAVSLSIARGKREFLRTHLLPHRGLSDADRTRILNYLEPGMKL